MTRLALKWDLFTIKSYHTLKCEQYLSFKYGFNNITFIRHVKWLDTVLLCTNERLGPKIISTKYT
jgi:hypothetical protein